MGPGDIMGLMAPDRPLVVEDEAAGLSVHVTVFEKGHKRASHVRVFERIRVNHAQEAIFGHVTSKNVLSFAIFFLSLFKLPLLVGCCRLT